MRNRVLSLFVAAVCFFAAGPLLGSAPKAVPFGLCPKYNPRIMYQLYQPFIDYLNENTPYRFEIKLSRSYGETIRRLSEGEVAIASCGPVPYIRAREANAVYPLVRPLAKGGKPFYHGVVVVRKESPIRELKDLKGRSFAFGQRWSTTGHIYPQYHMARARVRLTDLSGHVFLPHHDAVVRAVLKGEYDAGAVKDIIGYGYQDKGLRVIFVTDPIPTVPVAVRRDTPMKLVDSVKRALLKLDPGNPVDKKRMAGWDEEFKYGFIEASDSDYDPVRLILQEVAKDPATTDGAEKRLIR